MKITKIFSASLLSLAFALAIPATAQESVRTQGVSMPQNPLPLVGKTHRPVRQGSLLPEAGRHTVAPEAISIEGKTIQRAPLYMNPSGSTIYGWLGFTESESPDAYAGFTEVMLNGDYRCIFKSSGMSSYGFWMRGERVCTYGFGEFFGMLFANRYDEYDLATGKLVSSVDIPAQHDHIVLTHAYDANSDRICGYTRDASGQGYMYFTAPGSDPTQIEHVRVADPTEFCVAMTFNQLTHELIGINTRKKIVNINPDNGAQTELGVVDLDFDYVTGMCYSPVDKCYIWNEVDAATDISHIYKIDPQTWALTLTATCRDKANYVGLFCPDTRALEPDAPSDAVIKKIAFNGGDTQGYIVYATPTTTVDGTPLTGRIDYEAKVDGVTTTKGSCSPGTELFVPYLELSTGFHAFTLILGSEGHQSRDCYHRRWVGHDNPMAPETVEFNKTGLVWLPVTESQHGGYLDLNALRYDVYVDGNLLASDLTECSCPVSFPEGPYAPHTGEVVAKANGMESQRTPSNNWLTGTALQLPLDMTPGEQDAPLFNIVDWNKDGYSFLYEEAKDGQPCFAYQYNAQRAATDWLFLPAFEITDPEKVYQVEWDAWAGDARYPENYDLWLGTEEPTPYGMKNRLVKNVTVTNGEPQHFDKTFTVSGPGVFYLGFRCLSDANMYKLCLRNFKVHATEMKLNGPDKATAISAQCLPQGELKAAVTFTLPTLNLNGEELPADTRLRATVECEAGSAEVTGTPGQTVTATCPTEQGWNEIVVTCYAGNAMGNYATTDVYTGLDRPTLVKDLTMNADGTDYRLTLNWLPNELGANGGFAPHATTDYYLMEPYEGQTWHSVAGLGQGVTTAQVNLGDDAPQRLYNYGILTLNDFGQADHLETVALTAGKPMPLPMKEAFAGKNVTLEPLVIVREDERYTAGWGIDDPSLLGEPFSQGNEQSALIAYAPNGQTGFARVLIPKFQTKGASCPQFVTRVCSDGAKGRILARTFDTEYTEIATIPTMTNGWTTLSVNLPAPFNQASWVQIAFDVEVPTAYDKLAISSYMARDAVPHDLAANAISGASRLIVGQSHEIKIAVSNEGLQAHPLRSGTLTVSNSAGEVLATVPTSTGGNLDPEESTETSATITPEVDWGKEVTLTFAFDSPDDNDSNDTISTPIKVSTYGSLAVTDLTAEIKGEEVELRWSDPSLAGGTESFEEDTPWLSQQGTVGCFMNLDMDGKKCWGVQGLDVPNAYEAAAFTVWNSTRFSDPRYEAADGDQMIVAFCPGDGSQADDWLVSPAVKAGSSISFKARAISYQYGAEILEIYTSADSDQLSDFTLLETVKIEGVKGQPTQWEQISLTLPQDARYFAIRYASTDIFGIMLDDFRFTPLASQSSISGYDILRCGDIIHSNAKTSGLYTDVTAPAHMTGLYYNVIPVLSGGARGIKSNTALAAVNSLATTAGPRSISAGKGVITVTGYEGQPLQITDSSGMTLLRTEALPQGQTIIPAQPGIYLVQAAQTTAKVVVK